MDATGARRRVGGGGVEVSAGKCSEASEEVDRRKSGNRKLRQGE